MGLMTEAPDTVATKTTAVDPVRVEAKRKPLFYTSVATTVLMLVMLGLGIGIATGNHGLRDAHAGIGYLITVVAIVAAVLAFGYGKAKGNLGTFFHALSLPILLIVQTGLGSMGDFEMVHIVLGALILVATAALTTLSARKTPGL